MGVGFVGFGGFFGERKAGHDVIDDGKGIAVDLFADRCGIFLVYDGEDGVCMGMIDKLVWKERMQQRFDRRVGRVEVE